MGASKSRYTSKMFQNIFMPKKKDRSLPDALSIGRYEQTSMYGDDSKAFIVALDFDGTITERKDCLMSYEYGHRHPHDLSVGFEIRPEMIRFIKFLDKIGAVCFIFTSRSNDGLILQMEDMLNDVGVYDLYTRDVSSYWNLSLYVDSPKAKPVYHILFDDLNAGVPVFKDGMDPHALYREWLKNGLLDMFYNRLCLTSDIYVNNFINYILDGFTSCPEDDFNRMCNHVRKYILAIYTQKSKLSRGKT